VRALCPAYCFSMCRMLSMKRSVFLFRLKFVTDVTVWQHTNGWDKNNKLGNYSNFKPDEL
jgi:hypothetical protein